MSETPARPDVPEILRYFKFGHLPEHLAAVAAPFAQLANDLVQAIAPSAERSVALRKLLEGKDAAVRSALDLTPTDN